ncbi:MAG: 2-oxoacid:acceptor oxidoreductase family protein, partial [Dehalococcoidia bacterium]|nr:2-oxoacid:acceptor oxidoreductase family protein [Dehalococcoidia bacterium]
VERIASLREQLGADPENLPAWIDLGQTYLAASQFTLAAGAFAAATGEISLDTLKDAVRRRFPGSAGEKNAQAVEQGYGIAKAKEAV